MSQRVRASLIGLSLLIALYVIIGGLLGKSAGEGAYRQLAVFSEVLTRIRSDYVESPDIALVTAGALRGLLESFDPYSSYLTPREYKEYQQRSPLPPGDVGLVLTKRYGLISVVATLPDSPSERAGLRAGDLLEAIAGFSSRDMSVEQARRLLAGEPGSSVRISVVRERRAEPKEIDLIRAPAKTYPVSSRQLEADIGYVRLVTFGAGTAAEVHEQLMRLQQQGARKLVLDLRGCAVGEASEAVETAGWLLEKGLITYLEGQRFPRQQFTADPSRTLWRGPVAVLIDASTAGPAEIVAAALLAHQRAEVIGEASYGVGSVQKVIPLDDGSALILSVAKYYTPSGQAIQDTGVEPSIAVEVPVDVDAEVEFTPVVRPPLETDPVVRKALEVLRAKSPPERVLVQNDW